MKDRQQRIDLIQQLSKQEGMTQPSPADWLRDQDEKSRDAKALSDKQASHMFLDTSVRDRTSYEGPGVRVACQHQEVEAAPGNGLERAPSDNKA